MSSLFGKDISQQSQPTLFSSIIPKIENEEQKTNIDSSLFNNDKQTLFGNLFNPNANNAKKDVQENKNENSNLFGTNNLNRNLFEVSGKKEKEKNNESNDNKTNRNNGGLFKFDLSGSGKKEEKDKINTNNLFKSPESKKDINKNLFGNNDLGMNFINKESKASEKRDNKVINEKKENKISLAKENINIFGKKEEKENNKNNNLFEISTSKTKNQNQINENKASIPINIPKENKNTISTNQTSNF